MTRAAQEVGRMLVQEVLAGKGAGLELKEWGRRQRREDVDHPLILVGAGTCGISAGADRVLASLRQLCPERGVALVEVGCIGLCSEEPLVDVQVPGLCRLGFRQVRQSHVEALLELAATGRWSNGLPQVLGQFAQEGLRPWPDQPFIHDHAFFAPQCRRVLANCGLVDPDSLEEAVARGAWSAFARLVKQGHPERVVDEVEASGLRGRGGGGFPTGRKWRLARSQPGPRIFICNADEGDPGAFMDRAVIEGDPHRVLEGLAIGALAIEAEEAWIYIRAEYPLAIRRLERAIAQARECGLLGNKILGTRHRLDLHIKKGAGAFVCGEETALIHSIEGKRGMPRPRPPYPVEQGLFGRPTVINNVETLANLPGLFQLGAKAWREPGQGESRGTKVFALSGHVRRTGLVEVAMGVPLRRIVEEIGGGVPGGRSFKAAQIGGPSGGCVPGHLLDVGVDYESLRGVGAMMGSGGLVVMDDSTCMVDVARYFMDFIQRESCGKCIPCREGTRQLKAILDGISRGRRREEGHGALERFQGVMGLERLSRVIQDASLCGLGQSAPSPVLSVLRHFREEVDAHVYQRRCTARVCPDLLLFRIEEELCSGCTACVKACPSGAIVGSRKAPHHIIAEACTGCGSCLSRCPKGAIQVD
jgi:NADH:ubiquinone oxidoreductase subunit F (NADH-binding)/Pyruvate/2-oxoacid:ferredoxin oxidoreductase delta subunit